MKLIESMDKYSSVTDAFSEMIKELFSVELDDDTISKLTAKLALSDIIAIDHAWEDEDKHTIAKILSKNEIFEYSMPGRGQVTSAASTRVTPPKREPVQRDTAPTDTPESPTSPDTTSKYNSGTTVNNKPVTNTYNIDQTTDDDEEIEENLTTLKRNAGICD